MCVCVCVCVCVYTYIYMKRKMATQYGTLAWTISRMEKTGRLQSMESQRVGHHWVTSLYFIYI